MKNLSLLQKISKSIQDFASPEYQKRVWRDGIGEEVDSYEEAFCYLFDDLSLDLFLDKQVSETCLRKETVISLTKLRDALNGYDDTSVKDNHGFVNPTDLLLDENWKTVQNIALQCSNLIQDDLSRSTSS